MGYPKECPMCGATEDDGFTIVTKDWTITHQPIERSTYTQTGFDWGVSETLWETSVTEEFFCSVCMEAFPEPMQQDLEEVMHIQRVKLVEEN